MSQISNKFLHQMPSLTIKGNDTGSTSNPLDLTVAQVNAILPIFTSTLNGLTPFSGGGSTNFLRADGSWAIPSGTGTVSSVGIGDASTSPIYNISNSPVTTSGTLTLTLKTQTANTILAGPTTGVAAQPTFRALVGADLPNPSASTLGGIESYAAVTNQFINAISTSGVPSSAQPAFTNISGTATIAQGGTGQTTASTAFNALSPITTTGDLIYSASGATNSRLAIGSTNQVLTVVGGVPTWSTNSVSNVTTTQVSTNASFFPLFVASSTNGSQAVDLGTGLTFNPSTNNLSTTTFTGALTGTASGNTTYSANNHGVVLSSATNTMTVIAPDASTTKALISGGSSADPTWQDLSESSGLVNLGVSVTASTGTITVALTDAGGNTPSASTPVKIGFRSGTAATGAYNYRTITASNTLSLVGASTLGGASGNAYYVYIYAFDNAGTVTLGASLRYLDQGSLQTSSTAANSNNVVYQPSALTSKPIRILARFLATNTTSSWASPTEVSLTPFNRIFPYARVGGATTSIPSTGTDTTVVYPTVTKDTHNCYSTGTGLYTVCEEGTYVISSHFLGSAAIANGGSPDVFKLAIKVNSTDISRSTLCVQTSATNNTIPHVIVTDTVSLAVNDTVGIVGNNGWNAASSGNGSTIDTYFSIQKISDLT